MMGTSKRTIMEKSKLGQTLLCKGNFLQLCFMSAFLSCFQFLYSVPFAFPFVFWVSPLLCTMQSLKPSKLQKCSFALCSLQK